MIFLGRIFLTLVQITAVMSAKATKPPSTKACPKVCPSGWQKFPLSGTDHCYLLPPKPIPLTDFWSYQDYCVKQQPTSYIIELNTALEETGAGLQAIKYLLEYIIALGDIIIWLGAYYQNGAWRYLNGEPWDGYSKSMLLLTLLGPTPKNGTCIYIDPKSTLFTWSFKDCGNQRGATACEMAPITDCGATTPVYTPPPPYAPPDCAKPLWADFTKYYTKGALSQAELITLPHLDTVSCATACIYYDGCLSYDINLVTGDCRLVQSNTRMTCTFDDDDGNWQHYDLVASSEYGSYQ